VLNNFSFGADDFYFTRLSGESSGKKTVLDGERRVSLECAVSDRTQIGFQWTLNGVPIENTTRRHQITSNLYFSRIEREADSGVYQCVATNLTTGTSIVSPTIALNIVCKFTTFLYSSLQLPSSSMPCQTLIKSVKFSHSITHLLRELS